MYTMDFLSEINNLILSYLILSYLILSYIYIYIYIYMYIYIYIIIIISGKDDRLRNYKYLSKHYYCNPSMFKFKKLMYNKRT